MATRSLTLLGGGLLVASGLWFARGTQAGAASMTTLAKQALSSDAPIASRAIAQLRAKGPEGLAILRKACAPELTAHEYGSLSDNDPRWQRLTTALDGVSKQRDDYASGLYWYTDLAQAEKAARKQHRPILSLRLLGNLDEELSCANSRFFRSALYPNRSVAPYLRDHFILHWSSERPVPKVTIDFGDGRKIETTLTGNSVHYVLDAQGRPVDAIPGLCSPVAFLRLLQKDEILTQTLAALPDAERASRLAAFHREQRALTQAQWQADAATVDGPRGRAAALLAAQPKPVAAQSQTAAAQQSFGGGGGFGGGGFSGEGGSFAGGGGRSGGFPGAPPAAVPAEKKNAPQAVVAGPLAIGKGAPELPLLTRISLNDRLAETVPQTNRVWLQMGALRLAEARLDDSSLRLVKSKLTAPVANAPANAADAARAVESFEHLIAADSAFNEYALHTRIHDWFAQQTSMSSLETLNAKVYAELFLTPRADPWLGLLPFDVYAALPNRGIVK